MTGDRRDHEGYIAPIRDYSYFITFCKSECIMCIRKNVENVYTRASLQFIKVPSTIDQTIRKHEFHIPLYGFCIQE